MNKVILIGNLTHDPELKELANDKQVCKMRIAVNGYKKDETVYADIDAWGQLGAICKEYLAKGRKIGVDGRLALNQWETEAGEKRQKLFIVADNIEFVSPRGEDGPSDTAAPSSNKSKDDEDSDVPF